MPTKPIKRLIKKLLLCLLILVQYPAFAQYSKNQIDSLLDEGNKLVSFQADIRQIDIAYKASKAINYEQGIVRSLIMYAKNSYALGQNEKAFSYITQAENASEKIKDPILIFNIRLYKGLCYQNLGFYNEADRPLKGAVDVAESIGNEEDRHYYLSIVCVSVGINCLHMGDKKARDYWSERSFSESVSLQKSSKYLWVYVTAASNRANRFTIRKQYDSAKFYTDKALFFVNKCTDKYKSKKYYAIWITNYHAGSYYYAVKKFDTAEIYFKVAEKTANQINDKHGLSEVYTGLAKVYTALNNSKEASVYFEKGSKLADSIAEADKTGVKTPLEYIVGNNRKNLLETQSRYHNILISIFILLLLIVGSVVFYRRKLENEVKLSREKVNELLKKLEVNEGGRLPSAIEDLKGIVQLAVNNDHAFFVKYNEFDPEFSKKLLNLAPNLTTLDLEFCLFCKLGFETKEIARYTDISVRTVEGKKYRLRKKLNISSNQDIGIWLNHI